MLHVTNENYEKEVLKSDKPVIVDFWAEWCMPCRMLGPIFEEVSNEMPDVKFAKLNTEEHPDVAGQYNIMGIPCMIVFKDGKEVDRIVGMTPKDVLKERIQQIVGN